MSRPAATRVFALLCLLLASSLGGRVAGQGAPALVFNTVTTAHGLSENSVYSLAQDQRGFVWMGTQDGLDRYDGAGVRVFRNDPQRAGTLSRNFVTSLALDPANRLWVGTGGSGVCRYNPRTERFDRFLPVAGDTSSLAHNFVRAVLCDRAGAVWVGTESGLSRFDARTGRFRQYRHAPNAEGQLRREAIRALAQTADGGLWVGTGAGEVSRLDASQVFLVADARYKVTSSISALCADPRGGLWIGTEADGVCYLPAGAQAPRCFRADGRAGTLPDNAVKTLFVDQRGVLWVGTLNGLARLVPGAETFDVYQHQSAQAHSLPDNKVYALMQDRTGVLWVATENGVSYCDPRPSGFRTYPITTGGDGIWSVCEDARGRTWVGTETQGLVCYDPATGQRQVFAHDPRQPGSLAENRVRALCFDQQGRLWVGTQSQGLDCLLPGASSFVHYRHGTGTAASLSDDLVRVLCPDADGRRLWIGTEGGLSCFDTQTGQFRGYQHDAAVPGSLPNNYIHALRQDRQGRLWVGTGGGGLCRLDQQQQQFVTFRANENNPRSLSTDFIRTILQARDGRLWVGTEGGGLCRLDDERRGRFSTYRLPQGLLEDVVYGLEEDAKGQLWFSSNKGLSCLNPTTGRIFNFDSRDGLPQDEFNAGAYAHGQGRRLYFGGLTGLVAFDPAAIQTNTTAPAVVFTGLRKFNQPVALDTALGERRVLRLAPQDYSFTLEFAALNYRNPDKNRYQYRLEGFDPHWLNTGSRPEATYLNLDPGTYTFRVRAANNDGVWNRQGASLRVVVAPAWYQTWWFRTLVGLAVAGFLYLAYRLRVRHLLALVEVRQAIARDLHDDMGSTLSSIAMLSQLARTHFSTSHPERAASVVAQIGESAYRTLDAMDDIVWSINPAHDSLDKVIARMRGFAAEVLEARDVNLVFRVGPGVQGLKLPMRTRREFYLLFKEAVNNTAKYSRCQLTTVAVTREASQLLLTVQDNGIGFDLDAPAQGGGNGMANMRSRAAAMRGSLSLQSKLGEGTSLRLLIPVRR